MEELRLCESDYRFMCVVWDNAPLRSHELVELCAERLGWKKSTTYTTLKKLCQRGFAENENSVVRALVPKSAVQSFESGLPRREEDLGCRSGGAQAPDRRAQGGLTWKSSFWNCSI